MLLVDASGNSFELTLLRYQFPGMLKDQHGYDINWLRVRINSTVLVAFDGDDKFHERPPWSDRSSS